MLSALERGFALGLVAQGRHIVRVPELTGIADLLEVHPTVEAALSAV
jgi:hypothetical protein